MAERDGIVILKWCLFGGNMFLWVSLFLSLLYFANSVNLKSVKYAFCTTLFWVATGEYGSVMLGYDRGFFPMQVHGVVMCLKFEEYQKP